MWYYLFGLSQRCSYADIMLAEAMHMLLSRVGPAPFEPFPRLLAVHKHITQMPAIAE
jgi:hypothetical protein